MCGSILKVLNLYSHHGARERPGVTLFLWLWGQELRGQRRVQRVCQQDKLELDLKDAEEKKGNLKKHPAILRKATTKHKYDPS